MGFVSKRAVAALCLALTAASCGTVDEFSGSTISTEANATTTPAEVALGDEESDDGLPTSTTQAEGGLTTAETTATTNAETVPPTTTTVEEPAETTAPAETSTTAAETTVAPPAARQASERIVTEADFEANGITITSSRSVSEEAAPQGQTCGVADPIAAGRLTQVFETTDGTLIAQYVQEGAAASDQWMAALNSMAGCNDPGVSPMRLDPGSAAGADQTIVLSSNGSDDDGGYMAVVGGRKGDLVTGFMTIGSNAADPAFSTDSLLKLLEIAIAG